MDDAGRWDAVDNERRSLASPGVYGIRGFAGDDQLAGPAGYCGKLRRSQPAYGMHCDNV